MVVWFRIKSGLISCLASIIVVSRIERAWPYYLWRDRIGPDLAALYAAKSTGRVESSYKYCMRIQARVPPSEQIAMLTIVAFAALIPPMPRESPEQSQTYSKALSWIFKNYLS